MSAWAVPAPTYSAEISRSCSAYQASMFVVDTLLNRTELTMKAKAARVAHETRVRAERSFGAQSAEAIDALVAEGEGRIRGSDRPSPEGQVMVEQVVAWREQHRGPNDASLVPPLLLLSRTHAFAQEASEARREGMRAIAVIEAQPRVDSLLLSKALVNVSGFIARNGDIPGGLPLAQRAVEIRRRIGAKPEVIAGALMNVCAAYVELGDPREAEPPCEETYEIFNRVSGAENIRTAEAAGNLGIARAQLGDEASALALYQQSIRGRTKFFGPKYSVIGDVHSNIGALYLRQKNYVLAEEEFRKAEEILAEAVGPASNEVFAALEGLGRSLFEQHRYDAADSVFLDVLGRVPPDRTEPLPNAVPKAMVWHAEILATRRRSGEARIQLNRADSMVIAAVGRDHLYRVEGLVARSGLELGSGDTRQALAFAAEACRIEHAHDTYTLQALPEEDILRYRESPSMSLSAAVRVAETASRDTAVLVSAWSEVVDARGLGRREMLRRLHHRVPSGDSLGLVLEQQYRQAARRADRLVSGASSAGDVEAITAAVRDCEAAGRQLARHLAQDEHAFEAPRATSLDSRRALPAGSALVAFQRVEAPETGSGVAHYVAFVQPPRGAPVKLVKLGGADDIDAKLAAWRAAVERSPRVAASARTERTLASWLGKNLWGPVAAAAGPPERVYVVADGELQTIAPCAWVADGDWPLLSVLDHETELVGSAARRASRNELLVVGNVDYGGSVPVGKVVVRSSHGDSVATGFEPLPASGAEVDAVGREWRGAGGSVVALTGAAATAAAFEEQAPSASSLHIASHTWALSSRVSPLVDPGPLRRVGIAFAGANRPDTSATGVLTAAEIADLDLHNVQLVVISACRSGLGQPLTGEGLLGLRSAFSAAGARTVVASLWDVSDESTAFWMQSFYAALRARNGDALLAARDATKAAKASARQAKRAETAYSWGAFVVAGGL
jgi:tetratricopeptide (TPR) repeat protein